jgi:streptomycin 6-kinase
MKISDQFIKAALDNRGEQGKALVENLPSLLSLSIERWGLSLDAPFTNLTFNYVTPGHDRAGNEVVLKIGVPSKELLSEGEALKLFNGRGAIHLIDSVPEKGILLLERARPGESLVSEVEDAKATKIAALVMKNLWVDAPVDSPFPTVADWMKGFSRLRAKFNGGIGPLPENLVSEAERSARELLSSSPVTKLLHGDLHQDNIVKSGDNWVAIDPKGLVGDPAYEVGAFLRNPGSLYEDENIAVKIVEERLRIFAEVLGFSRERMLKWAYVQAVLSAWWVIEDGGSSFESALKCGEILREQIGKNEILGEELGEVIYRLRNASDADKSWLDSLRREVYKDLFDATWGKWDEERHLRHFASCWEAGNIQIIENNNIPVGMLQLFETGPTIEISEIQISPRYQGKGLGALIIKDILKSASANEKKVTLSTGLKNTRALKLYEKLGFIETESTDAKIYMEYLKNE